jgi:hypothetical protein
VVEDWKGSEIEIMPITEEEFTSHEWRRRKRRSTSPEARAIVALEKETGIKFPCRWNHSREGCAGAAILRAVTRRYGQTARFRCAESTMYVWRVE